MFCISLDGVDVWDSARGGWIEEIVENTMVHQVCFKGSLEGFCVRAFERLISLIIPSVIVFQNFGHLERIVEKKPDGSKKYKTVRGFLRNLLHAINYAPFWKNVHTLHFIDCECFMEQGVYALRDLFENIPRNIHTLKVSGTTGLYVQPFHNDGEESYPLNFDTIDLSGMSLTRLIEVDLFVRRYLVCCLYSVIGIHAFRKTRPKIILPPALDMTPLDVIEDLAPTSEWFGALYCPITFGKCRNDHEWKYMAPVMDAAFLVDLEKTGIYTGGMKFLLDVMLKAPCNTYSNYPARYEVIFFAMFYARVVNRVLKDGVEVLQAVRLESEVISTVFRVYDSNTDDMLAYLYAHTIMNTEVNEDDDFKMNFSGVAMFLLPTWSDDHERVYREVLQRMNTDCHFLLYNRTTGHEFFKVETQYVRWICSPAIELVNAPLHIAEIRNAIRDSMDWERIGRTLDVLIAKKEPDVRTDSDILCLSALSIARGWM